MLSLFAIELIKNYREKPKNLSMISTDLEKAYDRNF